MNSNNKSVQILLAIAGLAPFLAISADGQTGQVVSIVAPNDLVDIEGSAYGNYPFDGALTGSRFQQVFDASQFSLIGNGGGNISLLAFRLDGSCRLGDGVTIPNLQINLSTTSREPDSLSPVFAENVGADDRTVVGPGQFSIFGNCTGNDPENLTMHVIFGSPFFYNPNAGNLLLDIRNYSGTPDDGRLLLIDGHDVMGDSISSMLAFNVNAQNASRMTSFGFVTRFEIHPVPEPSTWVLVVLGALVCAARWIQVRFNRTRTRKHSQ